MKKSVMQKWVKALRSGKYRQTKGALKNTKSGAMCCLGVLCDISKLSDWEKEEFHQGMYYFDEDSTLPIEVEKWAGMKDDVGGFAADDCLTELNDEKRWNFKRIADFIEKNYKKL